MAEPAAFGTSGFTTTRVVAAPRERVWLEWTEPDGFADWFGGVECEVPLSTVSMDVRPGGGWRATMFCGPDRREIRWTGEYHESAPGAKQSLARDRTPAFLSAADSGVIGCETPKCAERGSRRRCRAGSSSWAAHRLLEA
jgi:hypothetical protein